MKQYKLNEPKQNYYRLIDGKHKWYIGTAEDQYKYLRKSLTVQNGTGHETENHGYWDTEEEALEASEQYYEQFLVFPAYYMYMGDGTGNGDILYCKTKDDCELVYTIDEMNKLPLGTKLTVNKWSEMQYITINSAEYFGLKEHLRVHDVNEFFTKDALESFKKNGVLNEARKQNAHSIQQEYENVRGDGGMVDYYSVPVGTTQLSDLIYHKNMSHSVGEAFCALYRLNDNGEKERNIRKVIRYMELELEKCLDHS